MSGKGSGKGKGTSGGVRVPGRHAPDPGGRVDERFAQRVKTARGRTVSSTKWLQRQLNDPYVAQAKREGWRSRAAYKLIEIDERYRLIKPGQVIIDLGCAPGGWCQYAAKKMKLEQGGKGLVVGIDLLPVDPIPCVTLAEMDFTEDDAPKRLTALAGLAPSPDGFVDGVLSDMAANTTGHKQTDHLRIIALGEMAFVFARDVLKPGGFFLTKLFQGGETGQLITDMKQSFASVRHVKPDASRANSSEVYVLATGFRR
jgi:23S rRNA (uridine2552-2'-O)-methyltransferase